MGQFVRGLSVISPELPAIRAVDTLPTMDIFCFGDSITFGEYDIESGGWVDRLKTSCMAGYIVQGQSDDSVFNLGIGGETTRGMRARFETELKTRLNATQRSLITLAYGANDAARETSGETLVPQKEFIDNLSLAIGIGRSLKCEILLLNITPVSLGREGVPTPSGRRRFNEVVDRYNTALEELARQQSVELLDVNGEFKKKELSSLFVDDGVHPNAEGHRLISDLVRERVDGKF